MKKLLLTTISAVVAINLFTSVAKADCGEVSVTEMNWASGQIITSVASFIMEQGYGCEVTRVPSSTLPSVTSVAETGKPDVILELWVNSAPVYKDLEAEGKIKTASEVFKNGGEEAWWIPTYLAEKHPELKTLEGILANPELVGGRFHNCPTGWGCRVINDNLITAWDMRNVKGLEVFDHGSGETLATSIAAAYADKAPWFGYYWGPTSILGKYPMVKVDIGGVTDAHQCNVKDDCANPGKSAYPKSLVLNSITTDFSSREQAVSKFIEKMSFNNQTLSTVLAWHEDNSASADEAAAYFIQNYKDEWIEWLDDGAKKKLASLIN